MTGQILNISLFTYLNSLPLTKLQDMMENINTILFELRRENPEEIGADIKLHVNGGRWPLPYVRSVISELLRISILEEEASTIWQKEGF